MVGPGASSLLFGSSKFSWCFFCSSVLGCYLAFQVSPIAGELVVSVSPQLFLFYLILVFIILYLFVRDDSPRGPNNLLNVVNHYRSRDELYKVQKLIKLCLNSQPIYQAERTKQNISNILHHTCRER